MAENMNKGRGAGDTGAGRPNIGGAGGGGNTGGGGAGGGNTGGGAGAGGIVDTAKDAAQSAMHAVTDFAGQARERVEGWAGDVSGVAGNVGGRVQAWAGDAYDMTSDTMGDFGKEVTSLVRRYPIPALLVGFGVGLLLGRAARA